MVVILARRWGAGLAGGAVHAYAVPDDAPTPAIWTAACGTQLAQADAERVNRFIGAPCPLCMVHAFDDQPIDVDAGGSVEHVEPGTALETLVSPCGSYAAGLRRGELHRVASDAVCGHLDGRAVVQAVCGHLGWGPVSGSSAPDWPLCDECQQTQGSGLC